MNCPRGDHGMVVTEAVGTAPQWAPLHRVKQWHCIACGWRDDSFRDATNCQEREAQRRVVRAWHDKQDVKHFIPIRREGEMPMTEEGKFNIANARRKMAGRPPYKDIAEWRASQVPTVKGKRIDESVAPAARAMKAEEEEFIPGRFVAEPGHKELLGHAVNFVIGRTLGDWQAFLSLWKAEYPGFRLNSAQAFTDNDTHMKVTLSPETK